MRFPATSTYRGAVIVHHGFSSCPQEMATLGPPLAAAGYDVLFTLLPGHGNAIKYSPDAPNFLWAFLGSCLVEPGKKWAENGHRRLRPQTQARFDSQASDLSHHSV